MATTVFQRYETKFLLTAEQVAALRPIIEENMEPDPYFREVICNVYYDTPTFDLARRSLDHPFYREKVRMRSYETPGPGDRVFFEIKKKVDGIVYKRRAAMTLAQAEDFAQGGAPEVDSQIARELRYTMGLHRLSPKVYLSYRRDSYRVRGSDLRLTLDTEIRYRFHDLALGAGPEGELLLPEGETIMEVKTCAGLPLWLLRRTGEMGIFPARYSKYGNIYKRHYPALVGAAETKSMGETENVEKYTVR